MRVQIVGDLLQLAGAVGALGRDHAILYLAVGEHEDDQHPVTVERQEIDMAERKLLAVRHTDHANKAGHFRQQQSCAAEQIRRRRVGRQLAAQLVKLRFAERLHLDQTVDEHAITL